MKRALIVSLLFLSLSAYGQRLPRTVLPVHYDLTFAPDFSRDNFGGDATITVSVQEPVREVILHAVEIEIHDVTITSGGKSQKATVSSEPANEWVRLQVAEPLEVGPGEIHIRYTGLLNDDLAGFYLGNANGRKYATSQMEATDARRAFPGFDEPAMKATFAITAVIDAGDTALSNGSVISDQTGPKESKRTLSFATTPRMSSYLVALTVGDFACNEDQAEGVPLRICGTPDKLPLGAYSMEATKFILGYLNDYYQIPHPFAKLDQVGVADFRAGAMENVGSVIYRDSRLFIDPMTSTEAEKRSVGAIIAHEIAHMWFGNLVTMQWWDDIWLNEGFARWMQTKPLAVWKPEWNIAIKDVDASSTAIALDALQSSRAVRKEATTSAEIDALFDGIAYGKTAAVLRMVESYVGEEVFRTAIQNYLRKHSWNNATFFDFSDAIEQASGKPVRALLRSFIEQPGVPLVSLASRCDGGNSIVEVSQQRFFFDAAAESDLLWTIPVCFTGPDGNPDCHLLSDRNATFELPGCNGVRFANAGGRGYYLTQHSDAEILRLTAAVDDLEPTERLALLRDQWNLVRGGRLPVSAYLTFVDGLRGERELTIMKAILESINYIDAQMVAASEKETFRRWARTFLQPAAKELGWTARTGEPEEHRALRAEILYTLGYSAGDESVLREAKARLDRHIAGSSRLDPELRDRAVHLAAMRGDGRLYSRYLTAYRDASTPDERNLFLLSLARFERPELIRRTLDLALSSEVRSQDAGRLIAATVANHAVREQAWDFIETNWESIAKKLPERMLGGVLGSSENFCDEASLSRARSFWEKHRIPSAEARMAQALERATQCSRMRSAMQPELREWLAR